MSKLTAFDHDTTKHPLSWGLVHKFVLAGRAIVTIQSVADENDRYTYKVEQKTVEQKVKNAETGAEETKLAPVPFWFVSLLVGPENRSNYAYLGVIDSNVAFRTTAGTAKNKGASAANINRFGDVFTWAAKGEDHSHQFKVWHRGFCCKCGKTLTVPSSVATGFGPVCAKLLGIEIKSTAASAIEKLGALGDG
jgi:hypothetical protein